jgi:nucleoside-diphosphate-sugar epimerase
MPDRDRAADVEAADRVLEQRVSGLDVALALERRGVDVVRGDVRAADARRRALEDVDAVVHLAAVVGDPACARDPRGSHEVNVEATRALVRDARGAAARRLVFASTCSNYGRMADPAVPLDETAELRPLSLYAEQKIVIERELLAPSGDGRAAPTCLRFATLHGLAPRMRFDLVVNEFTRDLWAARRLEVFGERFWRPYLHVRDAARAVRVVLDAAPETVAGEVYNVGATDENYRKLDLVDAIREHVATGTVRFVHRDEDPRDYRVSFEKIRSALGFGITRTVRESIRDIARALAAGAFEDPFHPRHRNIP